MHQSHLTTAVCVYLQIPFEQLALCSHTDRNLPDPAGHGQSQRNRQRGAMLVAERAGLRIPPPSAPPRPQEKAGLADPTFVGRTGDLLLHVHPSHPSVSASRHASSRPRGLKAERPRAELGNRGSMMVNRMHACRRFTINTKLTQYNVAPKNTKSAGL